MSPFDEKLNLYSNLLAYRQYVVARYFNIYRDYFKMPPFDLDSRDDITLDFANCTICAAKENIAKRTRSKNYVMLQPCLRNNHTGLLQSANAVSNYMSFFTMLGGYCYIGESDDWERAFNDIVSRQFAFFRELYPNNAIRITIPIQYQEYLPLSTETFAHLRSNNCSVEYSETDEENLKWKYGIDGITGYGTRWEIQDINKQFINCGNDIILFDEEGKAIGIDFGSGLETLIAVKNGNPNLLYSNMVCSDEIRGFCRENQQREKLIDCLSAIICIIHYKKYKNLRVKFLIDTYVRIIAAISVVCELSDDILKMLLCNICDSLGIDCENVVDEIMNKVSVQQQFLVDLASSDNGKKVVSAYNFEKMYKKKCDYSYSQYFNNLMEFEFLALQVILSKHGGVSRKYNSGL